MKRLKVKRPPMVVLPDEALIEPDDAQVSRGGKGCDPETAPPPQPIRKKRPKPRSSRKP
jgi:hypothetical protein